MTGTRRTAYLAAQDPWGEGGAAGALRSVHAFDSEAARDRHMERHQGFVAIDTEAARGIVEAECGITAHGDLDGTDLDAMFPEEGRSWLPGIREPQDISGTSRMVWLLVPDDPASADRVAYAEMAASWQ